MIGRLKDLSFTRTGEQIISLTVREDFREKFDELKDFDLDVEIKRYREKRSLNMNAYFHVLVNKIAAKRKLGDDEVKRALVIDYGALAKDADGVTVGFKLPESVDVDDIYPYCRCFDTRTEGGVTFNCYMVYKRTRMMDTEEFSRLIDGAIYEAQNLGIETITPEEVAKMKALGVEPRKGNT